MITRIQKRLSILTQALLHIITLIVFVFAINIIPSYAVFAIMDPRPDASTYSGGLLLVTSFITLLWFVDRLSTVTKTYKELLIQAKKKNQSNLLD